MKEVANEVLYILGYVFQATIAHNNTARAALNPQMFSWTAPTGADGYVTFM